MIKEEKRKAIIWCHLLELDSEVYWEKPLNLLWNRIVSMVFGV